MFLYLKGAIDFSTSLWKLRIVRYHPSLPALYQCSSLQVHWNSSAAYRFTRYMPLPLFLHLKIQLAKMLKKNQEMVFVDDTKKHIRKTVFDSSFAKT
jgi:hypothetical protein